jgi:type IV secretion system protein TrbL
MLLVLFSPAAFALTLPTELAGQALDSSLKTVMGNLESVALKLLFALTLIQSLITGYGSLMQGDVETILAKFTKIFVWTGIVLWLLSSAGNADGLSNAGHFIKSAVDGFLTLAGTWTEMKGGSFSTSDIMMTGLVAYGKITLSVAKTTSTNLVNAAMALFVPGVSLLTLMMTFAISSIVIVSCAYIALKVFMVKLELGLILAIAPLSISLLGLNALRDQGIAPFKSMLALIYRTVVLGATVSAISVVGDTLASYVDKQAFGVSADVFGPLIAAAFGFVILAFVAHKSDSIASSLANGSASLGSGDVASAAAMGAAMGSALASGGAALATSAAKAPESMSNFLGRLAGGASIQNASNSGVGPDAGLPTMPPSGGASERIPASIDSFSTDGHEPVASGNIGPERMRASAERVTDLFRPKGNQVEREDWRTNSLRQTGILLIKGNPLMFRSIRIIMIDMPCSHVSRIC